MAVAQRSTSAVAAGSASYDTIDRWKLWEGSGGTLTSEQSTDTPDGFSTSFKLQVTGADTSVAAGDYAEFSQQIEAQNLQSLGYGTSSAKTITLSFHCKSNKTGQYSVSINKADSTSFVFAKSFTIDSADTWEKKTITITPDNNITSGSGAIANDNGIGFYVFWNLMLGSNYTGATDNAWSSNSSHLSPTGHVNWMDSTSNNFYITGVQLEIGEKATEFEHEPYSTTLSKCQRYYNKWLANTAYDGFAPGYFHVASQFYSFYEFPVQMRQEPTMGTGGSFVIHSGSDIACGSLIVNRATPSNMHTYSDQSGANGTALAGGGIRTNNDNDAYVEFKAEL